MKIENVKKLLEPNIGKQVIIGFVPKQCSSSEYHCGKLLEVSNDFIKLQNGSSMSKEITDVYIDCNDTHITVLKIGNPVTD